METPFQPTNSACIAFLHFGDAPGADLFSAGYPRARPGFKPGFGEFEPGLDGFGRVKTGKLACGVVSNVQSPKWHKNAVFYCHRSGFVVQIVS